MSWFCWSLRSRMFTCSETTRRHVCLVWITLVFAVDFRSHAAASERRPVGRAAARGAGCGPPCAAAAGASRTCAAGPSHLSGGVHAALLSERWVVEISGCVYMRPVIWLPNQEISLPVSAPGLPPSSHVSLLFSGKVLDKPGINPCYEETRFPQPCRM